MDIETVLSGANTTYLLGLLDQYRINPSSIHPDWIPLLENLSSVSFSHEEKPSWGMSFNEKNLNVQDKSSLEKDNHKNKLTDVDFLNTARILALIQSYKESGHLLSDLDPLGMNKISMPSCLNPQHYGFGEDDYQKSYFVNGFLGKDYMRLSEVLNNLQQLYCKKIGYEYLHIQDRDQRLWLDKRIEQQSLKINQERKKWILRHLTKAEFFEKFIHVKFPGAKRFGLDGGESLIPALWYLIEKKVESGVLDIRFGMPHRGRLSTLVNVIGKKASKIFSLFEGMSALPETIHASGDVKYHLGHSNDVDINGRSVHLSLLANPSHLEAVNPVLLGNVRAKQDFLKDNDGKKVLGVLLHGDASFAGQGIVYETMGFCKLDGYKTGGTFHIIVNNQIGFTTPPQSSRSFTYCSDLAKSQQAPIFHVNADDPESVLLAMELACDYHNQFGHDVVIDLVCYRRFGHNEGDEPFFTQPVMYENIQKKDSVRALYENHLLSKGILTKEEAQTIKDNVDYDLKHEYQLVQDVKGKKTCIDEQADWLSGEWQSIEGNVSTKDLLKPVKTGVDSQLLRALGLKSLTPSIDFELNKKIIRQWEQKRESLNKGEGIDWALAESLAFASCLVDKIPVRLSGQDCERGTFSHRHVVVTDQLNERKYTPLNHLASDQALFTVLNSPLSEFGVLGYEYGYSLLNPKSLVLWEGQFGDFSNGAQTIIDQFISSSESKWLRLSGLVMLLPHGLEGQGPEHSSARLERYLQLCAENNMIVANCSTPANYFHILRRQVCASYRKPLILMTPKSLLRHRDCVSSLKEMGLNTFFIKVIDDRIIKSTVTRIVLCSGKVYYDLLPKKDEQTALIRLEQFYPFPEEELLSVLKDYPKVPVIWCQEEPENMGAWNFLDRRIEKVLTKWKGELMRPIYVGRPASASPAVGMLDRHKIQQDKLIFEALKA